MSPSVDPVPDLVLDPKDIPNRDLLGQVFAALEALGGDGCVRLVGGCVRNALLGEKVEDLDLATRLQPEQTLAALKNAGIRAIPTGLEHGTITAVCNGVPFEITSLREDVKTDGRRAVVGFTTDWAKDAARRDFHLNALYADLSGQVFDPTGRGLSDLRSRRVVFVGDARTRILEDVLRLLRFFRFHAWYGENGLDPEGLNAALEAQDQLQILSIERVQAEFLKLLRAKDPMAVLQVMHDGGILKTLFSPLLPVTVEEITAGLGFLRAVLDLSPDPLVRLFALLSLNTKAADLPAFSKAFRLSRKQERFLEDLAKPSRITLGMSAARARHALYDLGPEVFWPSLALCLAKEADNPKPQYLDYQKRLDGFLVPEFPLSGEDLIQMGSEKGPALGEILNRLKLYWAETGFPNREQMQKKAREVLG